MIEAFDNLQNMSSQVNNIEIELSEESANKKSKSGSGNFFEIIF